MDVEEPGPDCVGARLYKRSRVRKEKVLGV